MGKKHDTKEIFIKKALSKLPPKFDYSNVVYVNSTTKVEIKCLICNTIFWQKPNDHLSGHGCKVCTNNKQTRKKEEFIQLSNEEHKKDLYNYSEFVYINSYTRGIIICKIHGRFEQTPHSHLNGHGCPKCGNESGSRITVSKPQIEFLNYLNIEKRDISIGCFIVDGIQTNIIYEFLGDYWHGNPDKFNKNKKNSLAKKTFGELYDYTFERFKTLKSMGYDIKYIWENDWNKFKSGIDKEPKILIYE